MTPLITFVVIVLNFLTPIDATTVPEDGNGGNADPGTEIVVGDLIGG